MTALTADAVLAGAHRRIMPQIKDLHLRELFADDPGASRALLGRRRGPVPRLLEEPHHR